MMVLISCHFFSSLIWVNINVTTVCYNEEICASVFVSISSFGFQGFWTISWVVTFGVITLLLPGSQLTNIDVCVTV